MEQPQPLEPLEYELKFHQPKLDTILNEDGFVIFISGPKKKGKTNLSLLLAELCYQEGYRKRIATNIKTESYLIEQQITDYETLEDWLKEKGRKLFIHDELGKSIKKMRFMSDLNLLVMDIIQLIRHYDAGYIGIAPNATFIDSNFMNTDILDAHIHKISQKRAIVFDNLNNSTYFLNGLPETTIEYNSKDIAIFERKRRVNLTALPLCCKVSFRYAQVKLMEVIEKEFNLNREQIKRLLIKHILHTMPSSHVTYNEEDKESLENPTTP